MKKIISLSVFDNVKNAARPIFYWQHLRHVIQGCFHLFPEWEVRIYHDKSLYNNYYGGALLRLQEKGLLRLVYMGEEPNICRAMLWRLEPLFDSEVDVFICRDTDYFPSIREKTMVEQFISSGKAVHSIQDNPAHSCPMLGGMIGFNTKEVFKHIQSDSMGALLAAFDWGKEKLSEHGTDQMFMNLHLWPVLKKSSCLHSIRGNTTGASLHLPDVPRKGDVDQGPTFIGTSTCDQEMWYKGMSSYRNETIQAIEEAERDSFIDRNVCNNDLANASVNKRRVLLAMDNSPDYFFFAPIVSLLWQKYMGYCPVIMLVGDVEDWVGNKQKKLVLDEARKVGAEIHFLPMIEGYRPASIAQNARLYISCIPTYTDMMYFLTSDMDMLPLNRDWFWKQDRSKRVHLDYSNVYNHAQYPLCYVGSTVHTWREIMNPSVPDNLIESMRAQFLADRLLEETDGLKVWCYDEKMFGEKIKSWVGYPKECQMFDRYGCPPVDRIDRSCWPSEMVVKGMVDCHSVRPAHTSPNWEKVMSVLMQIMDDADVQAMWKYREQFFLKGDS